MELKQLVMLALQVSILATVFGFGLNGTTADLLYLIRRPALLLRSLVAVFVIMPALAVSLALAFDFPRPAEIVLVSVAMSPVPPLLPRKETKAGGHASYGLGLMAILSLASIAIVPAMAAILGYYFERPFAMAPGAIAKLVISAALVPLAAGMAVRAMAPALANRLEPVVGMIANVLLPVAVVVLVVGAFSAIWALVGQGTILAIVIFTVAGLAIGHLLGGPDPHHAVVLALSTACRHPAIALAVASTNFPNERFGALILLYLIVNALAGIPYVMWQRRRVATGMPADAS
jgi:BASS family bile acid:Na+ symporter